MKKPSLVSYRPLLQRAGMKIRTLHFDLVEKREDSGCQTNRFRMRMPAVKAVIAARWKNVDRIRCTRGSWYGEWSDGEIDFILLFQKHSPQKLFAIFCVSWGSSLASAQNFLIQCSHAIIFIHKPLRDFVGWINIRNYNEIFRNPDDLLSRQESTLLRVRTEWVVFD